MFWIKSRRIWEHHSQRRLSTIQPDCLDRLDHLDHLDRLDRLDSLDRLDYIREEDSWNKSRAAPAGFKAALVTGKENGQNWTHVGKTM